MPNVNIIQNNLLVLDTPSLRDLIDSDEGGRKHSQVHNSITMHRFK
jgi:hypothetical protein